MKKGPFRGDQIICSGVLIRVSLSPEGHMQYGISRIGGLVAPFVCALALGACFHPASTASDIGPAGRYGGTVVAYPSYGYGSPYDYGYGYDPYLGSPYGYGYGYRGYLSPNVIIIPRGDRGTSGRLGANRHHQYGLRPWGDGHQPSGLRPPATRVPVGPPRTAQPRPPASPRTSVSPRAHVSPPRPHIAPPPPQHSRQAHIR
jgi:hypothetical protein